jgi:hypothetical protein
LPNALYRRDSLARYGQWPLWNAQILAGQPFAADPLAGMWYPPNLLLLLLPVTAAVNVLVGLHLTGAGCGVYRLLRGKGGSLVTVLNLNEGPANVTLPLREAETVMATEAACRAETVGPRVRVSLARRAGMLLR